MTNRPPLVTPDFNPLGSGWPPPSGSSAPVFDGLKRMPRREKSSTMMADASGGKRGIWDKLRDTAEAVEAWQYQGTPVGQTLRQIREGRQNAVAQQNAQQAELWVQMQEAQMEHERAARELAFERQKLGVNEAGKDRRQESINKTNIQTNRESQRGLDYRKEMELNQEYYGQNILAASANEIARLTALKQQTKDPKEIAMIDAQIEAVIQERDIYVETFKQHGGGLTNPSGRLSPFQYLK